MSSQMIARARTQLAELSMTTPVAIQSPTITRDSRGAAKEDWTNPTVVTVNGRVMQPGGADRRLLDGLNISGAAYVIGFPYGTAVTAKNRLVVNSKTLAVLNVNAEGTDILYVRCLCYLPGD